MRTASTTSSANFSLKFRSAGDSGDPQAVEFVLVCVKKIAKQCSDVTKLHSSQVYEMSLQDHVLGCSSCFICMQH